MTTRDARATDRAVAEGMGWTVLLIGDTLLMYPKGNLDAEGVVLPAFSTDPAADYSVLVWVREKYDVNKLWDFGANLDRMWNKRKGELPLGHTLREVGMTQNMYEVGDYSRAFLATRKGQG